MWVTQPIAIIGQKWHIFRRLWRSRKKVALPQIIKYHDSVQTWNAYIAQRAPYAFLVVNTIFLLILGVGRVVYIFPAQPNVYNYGFVKISAKIWPITKEYEYKIKDMLLSLLYVCIISLLVLLTSVNFNTYLQLIVRHGDTLY